MVCRALLLSMLAIGAMTAPGCSSTELTECSTTHDCVAHGLEGAVCDAAHHCVDGDFFSTCQNSAQCIEAYGRGLFVCTQGRHQCADATAPNCQRLMPDPTGAILRDPNTMLLGATCNLSGPDNVTAGVNVCNGIDLAVREIDAQGGLPPIYPGGPKRPIAVIACDDAHGGGLANPTAGSAIGHLVKDLAVPVVLGTSSSDLDLAAVTTYAIPNRLLWIGHSAESLVLENLPDAANRVYVRTAPSELQHVRTLVQSISDYFEPSARGAGNPLFGGGTFKLLVVRRADAAHTTAGGLIDESVKINGRGAPENGGAAYQSIDYLFTDAKTDGAAHVATIAEQAASFAPHLIVFEGGDEVYEALIPAIEAAWTKPAYRPRLFIGGGRGQTPLLLDAIGDSDDLRKRVFGVSTKPVESENPDFVDFGRRYSAAFPDATRDGPPNAAAAQGYDAMWLAFYTIATHDEESVRFGGVLTDQSNPYSFYLPSMLRPSPFVDVGPAGIAVGVAAIPWMNLVGASGPLDIDFGTGTPEQDVDLWYCAPGGGFASSGYYYSAAKRQIVGTVSVR